jgi:hypothetical protein
MFSIIEDPVKKNDAKFLSYTEELRIEIWRPVYSSYGATKSPGLGLPPSSILFRQTIRSYGADSLIALLQLHSQRKPTTPKREILKANEPAPYV